MDEKIIANKNGFTLAEVLITLAIIGVVAALTIPALTRNTQNKEWQTKWKAAYSHISNATMLLNGGMADFDKTDSGTLRDSYAKVLKNLKSSTFYNLAASKYSFYDNRSSTWNPDNAPALALTNGSVVGFYFDPSCGGVWGDLTGICGYIMTDVNGSRGPNMMGKDFFYVHLVKKGDNYNIEPWGAHDRRTCDTTSSDGGSGCAAWILQNKELP